MLTPGRNKSTYLHVKYFTVRSEPILYNLRLTPEDLFVYCSII